MVHSLLLGTALRCSTSLAIEASRANRQRHLDNSMYVPVSPVMVAPTQRQIQAPPDPKRLRGSKLCAVAGCMIFLYIVVIPLFITSMVLFSIANGAYDEDKFGYEYEECSWSPWYEGWYDYHSDDSYCEEGKHKWDDWKEEKAQLKIWAIIVLIAFGLSLMIATCCSILLCSRNCSNNRGGLIHQEQLPAMTNPPGPQVINPVLQPVYPPAYNTVVTQHQYQVAQSVPQVHQQMGGYSNHAFSSNC